MLSERTSFVFQFQYLSAVLILVLMEYDLWVAELKGVNQVYGGVLILVLMEYALWGQVSSSVERLARVLILVLMEYALWVNQGWINDNNIEWS